MTTRPIYKCIVCYRDVSAIQVMCANCHRKALEKIEKNRFPEIIKLENGELFGAFMVILVLGVVGVLIIWVIGTLLGYW